MNRKPFARNAVAACFLVLSTIALLPAVQAAQISNGGFESGLDQWTTIGDASTQAGGTEGSKQLWLTTASAEFEDDFPLAAGALNRSGTNAASTAITGGLEQAVGLQIGALDPDHAGGVDAFEGSAASRFVSAGAGDTLSFNWNFGTSDNLGDYAFVVIDGQMQTLASFGDALQTGTLGNAFETGFNNFSFTFNSAGTHQIAFGVVDTGDFTVTSTLAVDGVQIAAVPEPSTLALMLAGTFAIGAGAKRRRDKR